MPRDGSQSDPMLDDAEPRVVPFRPAVRRLPMAPRFATEGTRDSLRRYERGEEPDDYRHRMTMNALVLVVVVVLITIAIWLADTIALMQKNQDCVLSGRRDCTKVVVPPGPR